MAAAADSSYLAGLFHAWIATRNSSGYPMGSDATPDTVANNDTKNAYKLPKPIEASIPAPTREVTTWRGGLVILGQRAMGVSDFGSFDLTLPAFDETFHALASGSTVDVTTHGNLAITSPNMNSADLPQMILGLSIGSQTDSGTNEYITVIFHNVQIAPAYPSAGQDSGANPRPLVYTVTPSLSNRLGWGMLYSASGLGVQDNTDICAYVRYSDPMMLATYIDDNSTGTFTLTYLPTVSDATNATNVVLKNGTKTNPTSVSTSTAAVAITAATAGDIWTVLYPTNFVTP